MLLAGLLGTISTMAACVILLAMLDLLPLGDDGRWSPEGARREPGGSPEGDVFMPGKWWFNGIQWDLMGFNGIYRATIW